MSFASPPCFAHELAATGDGMVAVDAAAAADVARWRQAQRERLARRLQALPSTERRSAAAAAARALERIAAARPGCVIAAYWPRPGELDLSAWMRRAALAGMRLALPVTPGIVVVPLLGYDDDCYRLGRGDGGYDRALAARSPRPLAVGVGHPCSRIPTIYPQPHDIPMDVIVAGDAGLLQRGR